MTRAVSLANLVDEPIISVDGVNNRIGINSTQPTEKLDVVGVVSATSFFGDGSNLTGVTANTATTATSAQGLTGTPDIAVRNITGVAATFTGVLTYEDVTNIDSIGIITARSDVSIADKIIHTSDTNTAIRFPAADTFTVETAGSEALRVDSSQRLLLGDTSVRAVGTIGATESKINIETPNSISAGFNIVWNRSGDGLGPRIRLGKSRTATVGGSTVVASGDELGTIEFCGADGTDLTNLGASIAGLVDGTPGGNDMPGRLVFATSADGSGAPTERLRITSDGNVRVPDNGKFTCGAGDDLKIYHNGSVNYLAGDEIRVVNKAVSESMAKFIADGAVELYHNDSKKFETTSAGVTVTGTVSDSIGSLRRLGVNGQSGAYAFVVGDAGKIIRSSGSGSALTLNQNIFTAGDMISVFNVSGGNNTVVQGTGVTLYNTANAATGTRTIAAKGMCTIVCTASNEFAISGTQLT